MTTMKTAYILAAAAAALIPAGAAAQQQLDKEIVIERDIVPQLDPATRQNPGMTVLRPAITPRDLQYSDRTAPVMTVPQNITLEPAAGAPANYVSPYRGYVIAGWPGLAAGYSIFSCPNLQLDVHAGYLNENYTADDIKIRTDIVNAGADLMWRPNEEHRLDAAVHYRYSAFDRNYIPGAPGQHFNNPSLRAAWSFTPRYSRLRVHAALGATLFNYAKPYAPADVSFSELFDLSGVHEGDYRLDAGVGYSVNNTSTLGIDVAGQLLHYNHYAFTPSPFNVLVAGLHNRGNIHLRPHYDYRSSDSRLSVRIGLDADYTHDTDNKFHVAPDVSAAFNPSQRLGIQLAVTGGTSANTLTQACDITQYAASMLAYRSTYVPLDATLTLRVGPFAGASLELFGGYAYAQDQLVPFAINHDYFLIPRNLRAWHAGARVAYSYRDIIGATVTAETATHSDDNSYYAWSDGARGLLDAAIVCTPIKRLQIECGYSVRYGRRALALLDDGTVGYYGLHNDSDLWAGVGVSILRQLSIFGRVNNILGHKAYELPYLPADGLTWSVAAAYKF